MKYLWFIILFFVLLGGLLFFGDGPASYVDVVGSGVVLVLLLLAQTYFKKVNKIPKINIVAWVAFLLYVLITCAFSLDIGISLRAFNRYILAFLTYYIFYVYVERHAARYFNGALLIFGLYCLVVAGIFALFPAYRQSIPSMNLLWFVGGHNHITDIWLLALPQTLLLSSFIPKLRYIIICLYLTIFIFSQARAALLIVLMGVIIYLSRESLRKTIGKQGILLIIFLLVTAVFASLVLPETLKKINNSNSFVEKKTMIVQDRRIEYWSQAIRAIEQKPLLGHGPGTFLLLSHKFQSNPNNSTWFAHNYVLEKVAELGVFGAVLFLWVLYCVFVSPALRIFTQQKTSIHTRILLLTPITLLVYGLVDFSLNYLLVWLIVWASIGITTQYEA